MHDHITTFHARLYCSCHKRVNMKYWLRYNITEIVSWNMHGTTPKKNISRTKYIKIIGKKSNKKCWKSLSDYFLIIVFSAKKLWYHVSEKRYIYAHKFLFISYTLVYGSRISLISYRLSTLFYYWTKNMSFLFNPWSILLRILL